MKYPTALDILNGDYEKYPVERFPYLIQVGKKGDTKVFSYGKTLEIATEELAKANRWVEKGTYSWARLQTR